MTDRTDYFQSEFILDLIYSGELLINEMMPTHPTFSRICPAIFFSLAGSIYVNCRHSVVHHWLTDDDIDVSLLALARFQCIIEIAGQSTFGHIYEYRRGIRE